MTTNVTSIRGIISNRFLQLILLAGAFQHLGVLIRNFAVLLFVMEHTGNNPTAVAFVSVAEYGPILLFSLVGGILSDFWEPKKTMILADILSGISIVLVLFALTAGFWWAAYIIIFVSASLSQFSLSSRMKLFKELLREDEMQSGFAFYQAFMSGVTIIGPILGTFIYMSFGVIAAIGATAIAFLISAIILSFIKHTSRPIEKTNYSFWMELKEGFLYVLSRSVFRALSLIIVVMGVAIGIVQALGIFVITERLQLPKESFQYLISLNAVAMLIGGFTIAFLGKRLMPQWALAVGLIVNTINVLAIVLSTSWPLTFTLQFINGIFTPTIHIGITTIMLNITQEKYVGRVNGVLNLFSMIAMISTMSVAGWLKQQLSLVSLYGIASGFFLLSFFVVLKLNKGQASNVTLMSENVLAEGEIH